MSGEIDGGVLDVEERKALARVWFDEVINNRNPDAILAAYSPAYIHRSPGDYVMDRDGGMEVANRLIASSDDRTAQVLDQITDGDAVVTRFRSTGTWSQGAPPHRTPGISFEVHGIVISRFDEHGIVEDWEVIDVRDQATT